MKKKNSGVILMQVCSQPKRIYYVFLSALFAAIGNAKVTGVFRILSNIRKTLYENSLRPLTIFGKSFHLRCLTDFWIRL